MNIWIYVGKHESFRKQSWIAFSFSVSISLSDEVFSRLCTINAQCIPVSKWLIRRNIYQQSRARARLRYAQLWILNQSLTTSIEHEKRFGVSSWKRSEIISHETPKFWLHYREIREEELGIWHTRYWVSYIEYFVAAAWNRLHLWLLWNFPRATI